MIFFFFLYIIVIYFSMYQVELDGYIGADCPLCGYAMIHKIQTPLISKEEEEEMLSWVL